MEDDAITFWFNLWESAFWAVIGVVILVKGWRRTDAARVFAAWASMSFLAFGVSDLIEANTGAWWKPWWLFAFKAACVISLVVCLIIYQRGRKSPQRGKPIVEGQSRR